MAETSLKSLSRVEFGQAIDAAVQQLAARRPALDALATQKRICLYGYGTVAKVVAGQFQRAGLEVVISDTHEASLERARRDGHLTVSAAEAAQYPLVIAAAQNQTAIRKDFPSAFYLTEAMYAFKLAVSCSDDGRLFTDSIADALDAHYDIYRLLDPESQVAYLDVLRFRVSLDPRAIQSSRRPLGEMWLLPFGQVPLASFCDGGAYDGDTLLAVSKVCPTMTRTLTIEPNPRLATDIRACTESLGWENEHHVGALWSHETMLKEVKTYLGMVSVAESPDGDIPAFTLDGLTHGRTYDFVKLDIEGSELLAIAGGAKTLSSAKALAIAAYHIPNHLYEVPKQLMALNLAADPATPKRLAFRHYSECFDDSIIYVW